VAALTAASKAEPLLQRRAYSSIPSTIETSLGAAVERPLEAGLEVYPAGLLFEAAEYVFYNALAAASKYDSASSAQRPRIWKHSPPNTNRSIAGRRIAPRILRTARRWSQPRLRESKVANWTPRGFTKRPFNLGVLAINDEDRRKQRKLPNIDWRLLIDKLRAWRAADRVQYIKVTC
jgi:hypothetical protein